MLFADALVTPPNRDVRIYIPMENGKAKIVVLDGYTLNPGDLNWELLYALGECDVYDRSSGQDVIDRAGLASIVLTNKVRLSSDTFSRLPLLKYVGVLATGYNIVDVAAARQRGVLVSNVPHYGTDSVAQAVFAHILNLAQHVAHHATSVRQGGWSAAEDWCYWETPLVELSGQTFGIVGLGRIGRATARIAHVFGMRVVAYAPRLRDMPEHVQPVSFEDLLSQSDIVSLHCPLTPESDRMINADTLALMKPSAIVINTSRGALIDEPALAAALNAGRIAGAGLDVLTSEPPRCDNPLLTARNCQITPHIAWATQAARRRLLQEAVENVAAYLAGRPRNIVN